MVKRIMSLKISGYKIKLEKNKSHYDSIYDSLVYLNNHTLPLTKYRITTNRHVLSSLLSCELVTIVTDKYLLSRMEHNEVPHYTISPRGLEFMRRYESLQNLFN